MHGLPSLLFAGARQGMFPIPSAFSSSTLNIPNTPGIDSASLVSIETILACACGDRTNAAKVWLSNSMSSTY